MGKHYIGMSGEHGCLPDNCFSTRTHAAAVDSLVQKFDLDANRESELRRDNYLELNPRLDGASYAEIVPCSCDNPDEHNDA